MLSHWRRGIWWVLFALAFFSGKAWPETPLPEGFAALKDGPGKISEVSGHGAVLEMTSADAGTSVLRLLPLPVERIRGYPIVVSCEIAAEDISPKPVPWNGIKVMAHIEYPGGEEWPEAEVPVGTFDWRRFSVRVQVPEKATAVTLILGLEKVTGTVRFSRLAVTLGQKFVPAPEVAGDQPVFIGHEVPRLRGAMVDPKMTEDDLAVFADQWNGNLIRWQLLRPDPAQPEQDFAAYDQWLDAALVKTDQVLDWAVRHHVKVVVDLHSPPGGKFPSTGSLFLDPRAQEHFVEVWKKMARRFRGQSAIWGFDLVNEPNDDNTAPGCQDWQGLALAAGRAVREIDPGRTLIVEPAKNGGPAGWAYFNPLPLERVVYSFHFYDPLRFTHQKVFNPKDSAVAYPGVIDDVAWDREAMLRAMQPAIDFSRRYRVHMYVGEFSAIRWAPGADRYLTDAIRIFEEQGWDWSYHAYREWQGWSLEIGTDEASTARSATPTARFEAVETWYRQNRKPKD